MKPFDSMSKTEQWLFCTIGSEFENDLEDIDDIKIMINDINMTWLVISRLAKSIDKWVKDSYLEGERDATIVAIHSIQASISKFFSDAINKE